MNIENHPSIGAAREPSNTLYVEAWHNLPPLTEPATYEVTDKDGETHIIHVSKLRRRVLEALMKQPTYCASRCRLSQYVSFLKHEDKVDIATDLYSNDSATGRMTYGVYRLISKVRRLADKEVQS
ncbi:MAG: hypothetical protein AB3N15_10590 [Paracoccaceae bacterium]